MKIQKHHYEFIKRACLNVLERKPGIAAIYQAEGLSHKRFRWDCLAGAGLTGFICQYVYNYANDAHIETALKSILGKDY